MTADTEVDLNFEENPRLRIFIDEMTRKCMVIASLAVNGGMMVEIGRLLQAEEKRCWNELGIKLPPLTAFYLRRFGRLKIYRFDIEPIGIRNVVLNLTEEFPTITMAEIVSAVSQAWPHLQTGHLDLEARRRSEPGRGV